MDNSPFFFFCLILLCLVFQGFFAMVEMASVSFNKVRLQYYVSQQDRRALWLSYLLHRPALLFGTTLIGINTALIVGSECARRFYDSLGLSPDWAPLSQVVIVLIFAEIAPLFAGRRYAEHVALLGSPFLFFFSRVFSPLIWGLNALCQGVMKMIGKPLASTAYLSREELQGMISEKEESSGGRVSIHTISAAIFSLKSKRAKDLMKPLENVPLLSSFCTVSQMRALPHLTKHSYFPLYHREQKNIVGVVYTRDLLRLADNKRVRDLARQPWFIAENTLIIHILKQFRRNNRSIAIVLNEKGLATGILTLDAIVDEIFGKTDDWMSYEGIIPRAYHVVIDRSFPSETTLEEINRQFQVNLVCDEAKTLEEAMETALGHPPVKGESVRIDQFELTVEEASLLRPTQIQIRTLF